MQALTQAKVFLVYLLLLFGLALLVAAAPAALSSTNNEDCKKNGVINADGTVSCEEARPCDNTGEVCQVTKWHHLVYDPWVRYCSCTVNDYYSGPDPTTGICMAISIEKANRGQVGKCSTGGCGAQSCKENTDHKCNCQ